MKFFAVILVCLPMAACMAVRDPDISPPGMPLDREHQPSEPDRALTRASVQREQNALRPTF